MPQYRRKVAFSGKQKKEQLQAKRERKNRFDKTQEGKFFIIVFIIIKIH